MALYLEKARRSLEEAGVGRPEAYDDCDVSDWVRVLLCSLIRVACHALGPSTSRVNICGVMFSSSSDTDFYFLLTCCLWTRWCITKGKIWNLHYKQHSSGCTLETCAITAELTGEGRRVNAEQQWVSLLPLMLASREGASSSPGCSLPDTDPCWWPGQSSGQ